MGVCSNSFGFSMPTKGVETIWRQSCAISADDLELGPEPIVALGTVVVLLVGDALPARPIAFRFGPPEASAHP
jgi:hypothetical protein